ncbi:hypothetical protein LHFGNBLO_002041 [Mesorhizobium sp. AR10]|uniref:hypothetical protein n=1 Tax=Mesorhizobium sp. AR10 TaxID=2865839 RepID=UPI00215DE341|nr:hypothetical protein [Mesorhizobium sp. AR10]UVK40565.1 hypothetical protein LHFGNBLO_002041 [Mesorhizobium sp. AR10]
MLQALSKSTELCLDTPLYTLVEEVASEDETALVAQHLRSKFIQFDCYCIHCRKQSTFKTSRSLSNYQEWLRAKNNRVLENEVFTLHIHCQRNTSHIYSYVFEPFNKGVKKIGQYPSMEDIASSDIDRFRPVLEKEYFSELHRAGGLVSHGLGIAAFVYLRRIFERLIYQHHREFLASHGEIAGFETMRMDEKIGSLKAVLPSTLVDTKAAYGILSLGLHELSEQACLKFYPVVRAAIIAILEEDLQNRERAKAAEALRQAVAQAAGEAKSTK